MFPVGKWTTNSISFRIVIEITLDNGLVGYWGKNCEVVFDIMEAADVTFKSKEIENLITKGFSRSSFLEIEVEDSTGSWTIIRRHDPSRLA